jgi:NADPH-dependent 2,4-dienoyl-CoA reductase/sulfur reductase-like enzyme
MSSDRTLLVVGGGPAGVTAALQACELGAQVTLARSGNVVVREEA